MKPQNLLLLHGALGSEIQLQTLKELLSNDFNVHTLNFEGHGGLVSNHEFDMERFAENVLEKLQTLQLTKTHIFGYSMGGYVALTFAKKYPEKVDKIVTLGTKLNWSLASAEKEIRMLNPKKIEEKVPAFAKRLHELHHPNDWKDVMCKTAEMMLALAKGKRLTTEDLQQIQHNILIGIGALDTMVTIEESENVATQLPNGTLKIIADVKHPIEKIAPEILAKLLREFILISD